MSKIPTAAGVWMLLATQCGIAFAQAESVDAPPPGYAPEIDRAVAAFRTGRWSEARDAFTAAHQIFPNARTLRGIGMAALEMSDFVGSARALESALSEPQRSLDARQQAHARSLLVRCYQSIGRFTVPPVAGSAELTVNGAPGTVSGDWPRGEGRLYLATGTHEITIALADGRRTATRLAVLGGEDADLELDLRSLREPIPAEEPGPADVDSPEPQSEEPSEIVPFQEEPSTTTGVTEPTPSAAGTGSRAIGGWVLVATGAAAVVSGSIVGIVGRNDGDAVTDAPPGTQWSTLSDEADRATRMMTSGWVVGGLGLVAVVTGLMLAITGRKEESEARVRLSGVGVTGSF